MRRDNVPRIRELLRQYPNGLTARTIGETLKIEPMNVRAALRFYMVDTYIIGYSSPNQPSNHRSAIWAVVVPPKDKPYPKKGSKYDDFGHSTEEPAQVKLKNGLTREEVESVWLTSKVLRRSNAEERYQFAKAIEAVIKTRSNT